MCIQRPYDLVSSIFVELCGGESTRDRGDDRRIPRGRLGGGSRGESGIGAQPWWFHGRKRGRMASRWRRREGSRAAVAYEVTLGEEKFILHFVELLKMPLPTLYR